MVFQAKEQMDLLDKNIDEVTLLEILADYFGKASVEDE